MTNGLGFEGGKVGDTVVTAVGLLDGDTDGPVVRGKVGPIVVLVVLVVVVGTVDIRCDGEAVGCTDGTSAGLPAGARVRTGQVSYAHTNGLQNS